MAMCLPSNAPKHVGKFHSCPKPFAICFHSCDDAGAFKKGSLRASQMARSITRTSWTSKAMVRGPCFRFLNRPKPKPRTLRPPILRPCFWFLTRQNLNRGLKVHEYKIPAFLVFQEGKTDSTDITSADLKVHAFGF